MRTAERRAELHERVASLDSDQKVVFDEIFKGLNSRTKLDRTSTYGKIFFTRAGTDKKINLQLLQKCAELEGQVVLTTNTTGIAALL